MRSGWGQVGGWGGGVGVDVVQFSLLHITLFKLSSVQSRLVPQPVGYVCLSSVYFLCVYNRLPARLAVTPV